MRTVIVVSIISIIIVGILIGIVIGLYSDWQYCKKVNSALKSALKELNTKYEALLSNYSSLNETYIDLLSRHISLINNYTKLMENYSECLFRLAGVLKRFEKIGEIRERLVTYAQYVSTDFTPPSVVLNFRFKVWVWEHGEVSTLEPNYMLYIPVFTRSDELVIYTDIDGRDFQIFLTDLEGFAKFYMGEDYQVYCLARSDGYLNCKVEPVKTYVAVIYNEGSRQVIVKDWKIFEVRELPSYDPYLAGLVKATYILANTPYIVDYRVKYPWETLEQGGDYMDRAILACSLLLKYGFPKSRLALASIDTDGDGRPEHLACLAGIELSSIYDLTYSLENYVASLLGIDPYEAYFGKPNIMLIPSSLVNNSDYALTWIPIDPPDCTTNKCTAMSYVPGNVEYNIYNIIYAETLANLQQQQ